MAQFTIKRTQRSTPGRSGARSGDVRIGSGNAAFYESLGELGQRLQNASLILNDLQAQNQFSEAKRQAAEKLNELKLSMEKEPDSSQYDAMKDSTLQYINNYTPKNGKAAKGYAQWINQITPAMELSVMESKLARERDTARANAALSMELGRFDEARESYQAGINLGMYTKEEADYLVEQSRQVEQKYYHDRQFQAASSFAMDAPDVMLSRIKGSTVEGYDFLTPGDVQAIRNISQGQKAYNANQFNAGKEMEQQLIWDVSLDSQSSWQDVVDNVNALRLHSVQEKDQMLSDAKRRFEMVQKGERDPLIYRADNKLYWDMYQRAIDNKITEMEIRTQTNAGQITINDYKELNNVLSERDISKSKAQERVQAVKDVTSLLDTDLVFDNATKAAAQIKARTLLEAKWVEADKAEKPLEGKELTRAVITIARMVKSQLEDATSPSDVFEGAIRIDTDEEYDALPSGTIFLAPGETTPRRKP